MNNIQNLYYKITVACLVGIVLAGCSGTPSKKVVAMQSKDKRMTCRELQLEMNEAEFYARAAENNRRSIKNVLMPLGYMSTYMSAQEAMEASETRVEYLGRISEIMGCDTQSHQNQEDTKQGMSVSYPASSGEATHTGNAVPRATWSGNAPENIPEGFAPAFPETQPRS